MTIKTFRAKTLRDALAMVRAEFGDGAAVLHTREINAGPIARRLRGRAIEVAATPDRSPLAEQAAAAGVVAGTPAAVNRVAPGLAALGKEVDRLQRRGSAGEMRGYGRLLEAGVAPEAAKRLTHELQDNPVQRLADKLSVSGPIRIGGGRRVVALVGPTGVGKTTTLAKLAANYRLRDRVRVGLITVDTYRVAAVDQLRTYAEIIDLPMEVVATPSEMRGAVAKLEGLDLVLIDTAGRSPRDSRQIDELREVLAEARPDETHLVLSATATGDALTDAARRFGVVAPSHLLLTKLDESPRLGHAVEPVLEAGLPVGYLTDGQSVPEDIRIADARDLAERFLAADHALQGAAA